MHKKALYLLLLILAIFIAAGCGSDNSEIQFEDTPDFEDIKKQYTDIEDKVYFAIDVGDYEEAKKMLASDESIPVDNSRAAKELTGDSRILAAAISQQQENTEICRLLIGYGADINSRSPYGATYLHEIIDCSEAVPSADYTELMKLLLKSGEDVNAKGRKSYTETPLDYLMTKSSIITADYDEMFNILLDNGAKVTKNTMECCMYGDSGFAYAAEILKVAGDCGISETLEAVIADKDDREIIDLIKSGKYKDNEKQLITFFAAANCSREVLKTLQKEGFHMDVHAENGMSLLDIAAAYNTADTVEYLLEKGYDPDESINCYATDEDEELSEEENNLNLRQLASKPSGYTPLSFALVTGNTETVDLLLKKGLKFQDNSWCIAAFHGGKKAVDILLRENYVQEDYFIASCYIMCSDEMAEYLLAHDVDCNVKIYDESLTEFLLETGNEARYKLIADYEEGRL